MKCEKCGKMFTCPTIIKRAEYNGGKAWEYKLCPYCGAGESWLE